MRRYIVLDTSDQTCALRHIPELGWAGTIEWQHRRFVTWGDALTAEAAVEWLVTVRTMWPEWESNLVLIEVEP